MLQPNDLNFDLSYSGRGLRCGGCYTASGAELHIMVYACHSSSSVACSYMQAIHSAKLFTDSVSPCKCSEFWRYMPYSCPFSVCFGIILSGLGQCFV